MPKEVQQPDHNSRPEWMNLPSTVEYSTDPHKRGELVARVQDSQGRPATEFTVKNIDTPFASSQRQDFQFSTDRQSTTPVFIRTLREDGAPWGERYTYKFTQNEDDIRTDLTYRLISRKQTGQAALRLTRAGRYRSNCGV